MSNMKRTMACLAVMVIAAAGATMVAPSPSFASAGDAFSEIAGGEADFMNLNSQTVLVVYDGRADGYGIAVENYRWDLADPGPYWGWNRGGYYTQVTYVLHMPKDGEIQFRACLEDN
ncbi:MAG TPA: hypothetical protein VGK45_07660, partial [Thermoanaerobaculia bacterium]